MIRCGKSLAPPGSGFPKVTYPTCYRRLHHQGPCSSAVVEEEACAASFSPGQVTHACELAPGHTSRHQSGDVKWRDNQDKVKRWPTPVTCNEPLDGARSGVRSCQRQVGHDGDHSVDGTECVPASLPVKCGKLIGKNDACTLDEGHLNSCGHPGVIVGMEEMMREEKFRAEQRCPSIKRDHVGFAEGQCRLTVGHVGPHDVAPPREERAPMSEHDSGAHGGRYVEPAPVSRLTKCGFRVRLSDSFNTQCVLLYGHSGPHEGQHHAGRPPDGRSVDENLARLHSPEDYRLWQLVMVQLREADRVPYAADWRGHFPVEQLEIFLKRTEFEVRLPAHPKIASPKLVQPPAFEHPAWRVLRAQLELVEHLAAVAKLGDDDDRHRVVDALEDLSDTARTLREKLR